jgi:hypothetical protein
MLLCRVLDPFVAPTGASTRIAFGPEVNVCMRQRTITKFRPHIEGLEEIRLLSGGGGHTTSTPQLQARADHNQPRSLPDKFLGFRITVPKIYPVNLTPPFGQVLVQSLRPVPGRVYNILYVAVKNGTAQTLTSKNDFSVRFPNKKGAHAFPILTGRGLWLPNQWIVFYVMTKQYYPIPQIQGGFQFDLGGRSTTLVPGPSGIYLRLIYNPANFARKLNWIVAYGQGAQLGAGAKLGLPDTAINEIVAAGTQRRDFGGHF